MHLNRGTNDPLGKLGRFHEMYISNIALIGKLFPAFWLLNRFCLLGHGFLAFD
jgi:hypothetical protein